MPVRLSSARSLNNPRHPPRHALRQPSSSPPNTKLQLQPHCPLPLLRRVLLLLFLLLLGPAPTLCEPGPNCTFIEGYILQYVCHGSYVEDMRLQHKDRLPALGTPYAIWRRSDTIDPAYLLISFYDSPLFSCYTVVMSEGQFYCDGRNFVEPNTEAAQLQCINFPFHYTTDLYDACAASPCPDDSPPISVAIAYMKENIKKTSEAGPPAKRPPFFHFLVPTIHFLLTRYFAILLCQ
ncbi:uncharacterized protein LOC128259732 [Drosophila gunungcola]|uniref:Uncharacterized protein n=1 Tax=Drosophila gunungcola TaxID=103775 RepID=A0A9P9YJ63_9MUSC|nr:uncharacterized protein LOC128259732 [Drosophila gunungcola]KAI8037755.1 hypothetical protein M5D96_009255 [Drosophila gunungcola]